MKADFLIFPGNTGKLQGKLEKGSKRPGESETEIEWPHPRNMFNPKRLNITARRGRPEMKGGQAKMDLISNWLPCKMEQKKKARPKKISWKSEPQNYE